MKTKTKQTLNNQEIKYGIVIPQALYVREGANKQFQPIKMIPIIYQDEKVEIVGDPIINENKEKWYHIRIENSTYGYVKADFIKEI